MAKQICDGFDSSRLQQIGLLLLPNAPCVHKLAKQLEKDLNRFLINRFLTKHTLSAILCPKAEQEGTLRLTAMVPRSSEL